MSRKIKNIFISIFLVFMALGFYLNKNQIQPQSKPNGYSYYQKGDYKEAFKLFFTTCAKLIRKQHLV
ncbi:Uncharacterised protein [Proteus mirabilis]|uniref:Uncharacterized protein n=1 Tax=Proteus mirabilis TaxID=584 RepID=A0A379GFD7_PROMI|nr:Uncharacterised protein [Proteus mirabilis]